MYQCKDCGKQLSSLNALKLHELKIHIEKDLRLFKCDKCERSFNAIQNLNRHRKTVHEGLNKFECTECGKCFTSKCNLQNHMDAHKRIKRYKCNHCDKSYAEHRNLQKHMKAQHKLIQT